MTTRTYCGHCRKFHDDIGATCGCHPANPVTVPWPSHAELVAELGAVRDLVLALAQACNETGNPVVPTPVAEAISALTSWARGEPQPEHRGLLGSTIIPSVVRRERRR